MYSGLCINDAKHWILAFKMEFKTSIAVFGSSSLINLGT